VTLTSDTAEERIEQILDEMRIKLVMSRSYDILSYWPDGPQSKLRHALYPAYSTYAAAGGPSMEHFDTFTNMWVQIDSIIENTDLALCLTSKYLYIRECGKYYGK